MHESECVPRIWSKTELRKKKKAVENHNGWNLSMPESHNHKVIIGASLKISKSSVAELPEMVENNL